MKKVGFGLIIILLMISMSFAAEDQENIPVKKKIMIQVNGNLLFFSDSRFTDVYGSQMIHPGIRVSYALAEKIFISAGYDYFFIRGNLPLTQADSESTQNFFKIGGGIRGALSDKLGYRGEGGLFYASYKDEVLDNIDTDSAIGFFIEGSLLYNISQRLKGILFLGYSLGPDSFEGVKITLGGLKTGLGIGFCF